MAKRKELTGQVLLFPLAEEQDRAVVERPTPVADVVLSGSFRKDVEGLRRTFEELRDHHLRVLSPLNADIVFEKDGFVFMHGEQGATPESIESRHLQAIQRAAFVWLHAPEGYVGPSASLEIGFARAIGVPVYVRNPVQDVTLQPLVTVVPSVAHVAELLKRRPMQPPLPAVQAFQAYYAKAALYRGYENESAQDTLLLMLEEFGELARALRKRAALRRDSKGPIAQEEQELADIFIYVVHMANVLGFDLAEAVRAKENLNVERFFTR